MPSILHMVFDNSDVLRFRAYRRATHNVLYILQALPQQQPDMRINRLPCPLGPSNGGLCNLGNFYLSLERVALWQKVVLVYGLLCGSRVYYSGRVGAAWNILGVGMLCLFYGEGIG